MFKVKRKHASITMEIVFAILLSLGVLFLALGLYSDNIKGMMDNGGLPNVFNRTSAKTDYQKWGIDPTRNQITAPEVEATSWEALLADYNNKAKTKIEEYYAQTNGGTVLLDDAQKIDLAMWLAIYANSSKKGYGVALLQNSPAGASWNYYGFAIQPNVNINLDNIGTPYYYVAINSGTQIEKKYPWGNISKYPDQGYNISSSVAEQRVLNVRDGIMPAFK